MHAEKRIYLFLVFQSHAYERDISYIGVLQLFSFDFSINHFYVLPFMRATSSLLPALSWSYVLCFLNYLVW